jgi:penicillin-binding protein 1A
MGLTSSIYPGLSLALGATDATLLEMASVYGTLAAGGIHRTPETIRRVTDREGRILYQSRADATAALSPQIAYQITHVLEGVVDNGTGQSARSLGFPVAGKTGTTDDYIDAWFLGYTPEVVAGVWVGYDERKSLGHPESGSRAALPVFIKLMSEVGGGGEFEPPPGIRLIEVCSVSGKVARDSCPATYREAFTEENYPTALCPLH